jgi:signal transduction histidine kinase
MTGFHYAPSQRVIHTAKPYQRRNRTTASESRARGRGSRMRQTTTRVLAVVASKKDFDRIRAALASSKVHRFEVEEAQGIENGAVRASQGNLDAILLDMSLPGNGVDGLKMMRERAPRVPVVLLTSEDREAEAVKGIEAGAQEYVVLDSCDSIVLGRSVACSIERRNLEEVNKTLKVVNSILRHDVLNNLTIVSGALEVYRMKRDEKFLNSAMTAVEKSVDLIRKMKEVESVVSPKEMIPVDVRKVAHEVVSKYPDRAQFVITGEATAIADDALGSVLDNIVSNALIHSGTSVIRIGIGPDPAAPDRCEIRIADEGSGIPDDIKAKLFREGAKFGKTAQSGLGLFIVRKVLERYGGTIAVEDNKPRGSVFVLKLNCPEVRN